MKTFIEAREDNNDVVLSFNDVSSAYSSDFTIKIDEDSAARLKEALGKISLEFTPGTVYAFQHNIGEHTLAVESAAPIEGEKQFITPEGVKFSTSSTGWMPQDSVNVKILGILMESSDEIRKMVKERYSL